MNVRNSQSEKNRWKKWDHLSSFHVSFLSYGFCADFTKKPKPVKAIFIYAFESFHYSLSENNIGVCVTILEILAIKTDLGFLLRPALKNPLF